MEDIQEWPDGYRPCESLDAPQLGSAASDKVKGYAPGSWSQVALERTKPHSRVIGIDLIPAQPPKGVSTFQGDFLSPVVQQMVKNFIVESHRRQPPPSPATEDDEDSVDAVLDKPSYFEMERQAVHASEEVEENNASKHPSRLVDVSTSLLIVNSGVD